MERTECGNECGEVSTPHIIQPPTLHQHVTTLPNIHTLSLLTDLISSLSSSMYTPHVRCGVQLRQERPHARLHQTVAAEPRNVEVQCEDVRPQCVTSYYICRYTECECILSELKRIVYSSV